MPTSIDRDGLRRLVAEEQAQVAEVLPREECDWAHLAGAIHLPLKQLDAHLAASLDPARPIIVYCNDFQGDMSPRPAWRLERLGFGRVYDYVAGKMDWLSFALPREGSAILAADVVERGVPTCDIDERVGPVRARLGEGAFCVVVNPAGVVMGVLQGEALSAAGDDVAVEERMWFGVTTVRPAEDLAGLAGRMCQADVEAILVTSSDGALVGLLRRERAEAALAAR